MGGRFFGVDLMSSPIVPAVHHGDGLSGLWDCNVADSVLIDGRLGVVYARGQMPDAYDLFQRVLIAGTMLA